MRRPILVFLFLFFLSSLVFAAPKKTADVIGQAREQLSMRQRSAAVEILINEIKKAKDNKFKKNLLKELKQANEIFFTDDGLKIYETAEAKRADNDQDSLAQYVSAQKLEGDNTLVLTGIALVYLGSKECDRADAVVSKIVRNDVESDKGRYLQLANRSCREPGGLTNEDMASVRQLQELKMFGLSLFAGNECTRGEKEKCLLLSQEILKMDSQFPAAHYWSWRALRDNEEEGLDSAQKYLNLCNNLNDAARRKYQWDLQLCRDKIEPEKYLRSKEGSM